MIYTEEIFQIEDKTKELIQVISESQTLQKLIESKLAVENSKETQTIIHSFLDKKASFERIESYGKHAPDFAEKRRALRKEKRVLDTNELVMSYRIAESDVQETLDTISYRLAQWVSPDIKIDAGNPFFEFAQRGCGGSCHVG